MRGAESRTHLRIQTEVLTSTGPELAMTCLRVYVWNVPRTLLSPVHTEAFRWTVLHFPLTQGAEKKPSITLAHRRLLQIHLRKREREAWQRGPPSIIDDDVLDLPCDGASVLSTGRRMQVHPHQATIRPVGC